MKILLFNTFGKFGNKVLNVGSSFYVIKSILSSRSSEVVCHRPLQPNVRFCRSSATLRKQSNATLKHDDGGIQSAAKMVAVVCK